MAYGVSADGSVVVGVNDVFHEGGALVTREAFRWTQGTGMVGLGYLPGGNSDSFATAVSADGFVVVGVSSINNTREAFRWTQGTGMVGLGDLPGGIFYSDASGVSADGSVVVGQSANDNGYRAFRWTQGTGMVGLDFNAASGVSGDGSVVVGYDGVQVLRWTEQTGTVGLGELPGIMVGRIAVSADGSVVVASSSGDNGDEAFIWNSTQGMRSLQQVLTNDYGLDLTGWSLNRANAISADGLTVVGEGRNPSGNTEAWIASLDGDPNSQPGTTPTNPLLPTPNPSNPDGFTFPGVIIGNNGLGIIDPIFFDPIVSVGYDYSVTGGPLFASVLIPNALPQGDSNFILELPGFGNYSLLAGTTFNLLGVNPLGFSNFRISGIDPAEMLDPTNPTAFVTGLTFTNPGTVTVTQNPIIQNTGGVSVPEPSNLLGLGLLGFGAFLTGKLNKKQAQKDS
jgi:probable HAF family extracellular repeat protein